MKLLQFHKLTFWLNELNQNKEENHPMPIILVGHKADKKIRQISKQEALDFADAHGMAYIEASAKTNHNIEEIFQMISGLILKNVKEGQTMGTRIHPMLEAKSVELSAPKRGDNDSFFACCCLC